MLQHSGSLLFAFFILGLLLFLDEWDFISSIYPSDILFTNACNVWRIIENLKP